MILMACFKFIIYFYLFVAKICYVSKEKLKIYLFIFQNGELQPLLALSPLESNKPNSPAATVLAKTSPSVLPLTPSPPTPPVSLSISSPSNNIPSVVATAPAIVPKASLPSNSTKQRRIVRSERKSVSSKVGTSILLFFVTIL